MTDTPKNVNHKNTKEKKSQAPFLNFIVFNDIKSKNTKKILLYWTEANNRLYHNNIISGYLGILNIPIFNLCNLTQQIQDLEKILQ